MKKDFKKNKPSFLLPLPLGNLLRLQFCYCQKGIETKKLKADILIKMDWPLGNVIISRNQMPTNEIGSIIAFQHSFRSAWEWALKRVTTAIYPGLNTTNKKRTPKPRTTTTVKYKKMPKLVL